MKSPTTCGAR